MVNVMNNRSNLTDQQLIEFHGGVALLAKKLNYQLQRVQNWKTRGIPSSEKLAHPELFLNIQDKQSS